MNVTYILRATFIQLLKYDKLGTFNEKPVFFIRRTLHVKVDFYVLLHEIIKKKHK